MPRLTLSALAAFLAAWFVVGLYQVWKPLPSGVSFAGAPHKVPAESVQFFSDRTYIDSDGQRRSDQEIFDEIINMIAGARHFILVDMFLYNDFQGSSPETTRALADELTEALIAKKKAAPEVSIVVVSDPLNVVYGGADSPQFAALDRHGIRVVLTDLRKLRDSNPLYSALWRILFQWFGNAHDGRFNPEVQHPKLR